MSHVVVFVALALALGACTAGGAARKMDAPLRARLAEATDAPVEALLELADAPADARDRLAADGLAVRTVAGDVAVVSGLPDAVRRAARHDWVVRLELSQDRPALPNAER